MNTSNHTQLRERSLAFLIHAADQLVRAERADILASEGIRRHDLRLLRRLARPTDASAAHATAADDTPPREDHHGHEPHGDDPHGHGYPRRGHEHRARFGFRLRHLLMRGWVTVADGRPAITAEGRVALARIDERLAASRARIESALTPEQLTATTEALSSIVEELGGTQRLRDVRCRHRLMRHLREGGPRHGFGGRGFDRYIFTAEHRMHPAHAEHGAHRHGGFHDGDSRHHTEFRDGGHGHREAHGRGDSHPHACHDGGPGRAPFRHGGFAWHGHRGHTD